MEQLRIKDNMSALSKLRIAETLDPKSKDLFRSWSAVLDHFNSRLEEKMQQIAGDNIFPVEETTEEDFSLAQKTVDEMDAYAEKEQNKRKLKTNTEQVECTKEPSLSEIIFFSADRLRETMRLLSNIDRSHLASLKSKN